MPELKVSGNIGFIEGKGTLINVGALGLEGEFGGKFEYVTNFEACHGLLLDVGAVANAHIAAQLKLLWAFLGHGELKAYAGAGVSAGAQLKFVSFDAFGFNAEVRAFAEASLAGSLSVGITFEDIADFGRERLDNAAYDIFIAFLNELDIKFGVWANISAAAKAKAWIKAQGSFKDDNDAGFKISYDAELGAGYGGGVEMFLGAKLKKPKRFFLYATERVTQEITFNARKLLPSASKSQIVFLEFILPVVFNSAYELGQMLFLQAVTSPVDEKIKPFNDNFQAQLRRFTLDKIAEGGLLLISQLLKKYIDTVSLEDISDKDKTILIETIESTLLFLKKKELNYDTINELINSLIDIFILLKPGDRAEWRRNITITWLAFSFVQATRLNIGTETLTGSISGGLVGLKSFFEEYKNIDLPKMPVSVKEELQEKLGSVPKRMEISHVVDYLLASGITEKLKDVLPELVSFFDFLEETLDITPGTAVASALQLSFGDNLTETELYIKCRNFCKRSVEGQILGRLIPALEERAGRNQMLLRYIKEVTVPSLQLFTNYVFDCLDDFVATTGTGTRDTLWLSFATALSNITAKVLNTNVAFFTEALLTFMIERNKAAIEGLIDLIRKDKVSDFNKATDFIEPYIDPVFAGVDVVAPTRNLFTRLLKANAEVYGDKVWTAQRKVEYFSMIKAFFNAIDNDDIYGNKNETEAFFEELANCAYLPNKDGCIKFVTFHSELLMEISQIVLPKILNAIELFYLELTYAAVLEIDNRAREFVSGLFDGLRQLQADIRLLERIINRRIEEIEEQTREMGKALSDIAGTLNSRSFRNDILDDVETKGRSAAISAMINLNPFFYHQPKDWRSKQRRAAADAFSMGFDIFRPLLNEELRHFSIVANGLGQMLDSAATSRQFLQKIKDKAQDVVIDKLEDMGINLPGEIGIDEVEDAINSFLDVTSIKNLIQAALDAKTAVENATSDLNTARTNLGSKQSEINRLIAAKKDKVGEDLILEIVNPLPVKDKNPTIYTPKFALTINLKNAKSAFLNTENPGRILIILNGNTIPFANTEWAYNRNRNLLTYSKSISTNDPHIKQGINVIECSVATGAQAILRERVSFLCAPK